jgi:glycosyltransferase involved in cell wall biosynthesis
VKIAVDFTAGVRQYGGVGRYTRSLVHALAGALAEEDSNDLLTLLWAGPARVALPEGWPNTRTQRLPLPEQWMTRLWQRLRVPLPADVLAGGSNVFYCPDFTLPPVARARCAVTVHDLSYLIHPETHYPPLRRYLESAVPRAIDRASLVLADSEQTKSDVIQFLGTPPDKIVTVLSAADPLFQPASPKSVAEVRSRYALAKPYLISVGTIQPRKNLTTIFEALRQLVSSGRDLQLIHVGRPGWLYEPIFEALERSGLKDRVTIVGASDDDLVALYTGAVAFVFPSLYEGFGIPCLEAMACGTPVIASNAGSLAEVVEDAGITIDPHDAAAIASAVVRLMDDRDFRADLIGRAHTQHAKFQWPASGRQLRDLLRGLGAGR